MKTLLKYITLLIFGGVIIPLYQPQYAAKTLQFNPPAPVVTNSAPVQHNDAARFYFLYDVAVKLLPVADLFK
jgi:hypothetical protein